MKIQVEMTGTTPLLMHNPRMIDPEFEVVLRIKELTSKRKKTEGDLREIAYLEWIGGAYTDTAPDGKEILVQPSSKVRKCFIEAARIRKLGKQVERSLSFLDLNVPLQYEGSKDIEQLAKTPKFISRLPVKVGQARVMRVRPQFNPWGLTLYGILLEDAGLNFHELVDIASTAGQAQGIGDNRVNGYGRFSVRVQSLNEDSNEWESISGANSRVVKEMVRV